MNALFRTVHESFDSTAGPLVYANVTKTQYANDMIGQRGDWVRTEVDGDVARLLSLPGRR